MNKYRVPKIKLQALIDYEDHECDKYGIRYMYPRLLPKTTSKYSLENQKYFIERN